MKKGLSKKSFCGILEQMASFDLDNKEFNHMVSSKTKKWGIITIILCSVLFLILFTSFLPFLQSFLLGSFGVFIYPLVIVTFVVGIALVNNKKYVMPKKYIFLLLTAVYLLLGLVNIIILGKPEISFGEYFVKTYNSITAGGVLAGLLSGALLYTIGLVGSIILYLLGLVVVVAFIVDFLNSIKVYGFKNVAKGKDEISKIEVVKPPKEQKPAKKIIEEKPETFVDDSEDFNIFLNNKQKKEQELYDAKVKLGLIEGNLDSAKSKNEDPKSLREHLLSPPKFETTYFSRSLKNSKENEIKQNIDLLKKENVNPNNNFVYPKTKQTSFDEMQTQSVKEKINQINASQNQNITEKKQETSQTDFEERTEYVDENYEEVETNFDDISNECEEIFDEDKDIINEIENQTDDFEENAGFEKSVDSQPKEKKFATLDDAENELSEQVSLDENKESVYIRPPIDLLEKRVIDMSSVNENVYEKSKAIEDAMQEFNINAKVVGVVVGPAVTKFELEMPHGVSVKKILGLTDDISLALAAKSKIRIEAPVPGKSVVGIEVPNDKIAMVSMRELVESDEFRTNKSPIAFALGKGISGENMLCNINKMPHLLIAGATNSGKSVCLNAILLSILFKASPDDVRLILVDPKRVEFSMYNDLPHLLMPSVITEVEKAINALNWAINEMEQRFSKLQEYKCRNIDEFNSMEEVKNGQEKKMPFIVIMIDELNDLMSTNKKEVEEKIMRLAQKARAAGIHLIIATQRPSVDVITGTIKANFPSRISFALTSYADSKTILEMSGAENLLGYGDMLYKPSDVNFPKRIQGCYVDKDEVERVVSFIKEHNPTNFDEEFEKKLSNQNSSNVYSGAVNGDKNWDPLLPQVLKMCIQDGKATISAAQRRFVIGFPRAGRIIDQIAELGYISKGEGQKPREVYITMQEFYEKFGDID